MVGQMRQVPCSTKVPAYLARSRHTRRNLAKNMFTVLPEGAFEGFTELEYL